MGKTRILLQESPHVLVKKCLIQSWYLRGNRTALGMHNIFVLAPCIRMG